MRLRAVVYQIPDHHRSRVICEAMSQGLKHHGVRHTTKFENEYQGNIEADTAVFYGLEGRLNKIFRDYSERAKAVYIDLGYWKRKERHDRFGGYHKVVVNDRHPTTYFQNRKHDGSRAQLLEIGIEPWHDRVSGHILLAGMGDKGARAEGYAVEEWERWAIKKIREYSDRKIIYRPKPSYRRARPIQGVGYSPRTVDVSVALSGCHTVVTHHSNVAIDGICKGIPAFAWKGAALKMTLQDLAFIEKPYRPEGREQWINDLSWCQWNVEEMKKGLAWNHLLEEGLL